MSIPSSVFTDRTLNWVPSVYASSLRQAIVPSEVNPINASIPYSCVQHMNDDSLIGTMEYLNLAEIGSSARVCKAWKEAIDSMGQCQEAWKALTERMGIPLVNSIDGAQRNHKEDLKALYPITLSGLQISETLGKPVGKTPSIDVKWFNMLSMEDPYEPGKLMGETFRFVCVYSHIERTFDAITPLILDKSGNLVDRPQEVGDGCTPSCLVEPVEAPKPTQIPLSLKNQRTLSKHPLKGKENMPVFREDPSEYVFDQCDTCVPRNWVYFMRDQVVPESRNMSYPDQMALVKARGAQVVAPGFKATPVEVRTLYSVVSVLNGGACSDNESPLTYAQTSNIVNINHIAFHVLSGGFVRGSGLRFGHRISSILAGNADMGVAPSAPAEFSRH